MPRFSFFILLNVFSCALFAQAKNDTIAAKYWKDPKYKAANTAANIAKLGEEEKLVYYYLNLARMNPPLFAKTYVAAQMKKHLQEVGEESEYERSLYDTLLKMAPRPLLEYDSVEHRSAICLAEELNRENRFSHERTNCKDNRGYECCSAGRSSALDIVMLLLVDVGYLDADHRRICLLPANTRLGVAIGPHPKWKTIAVLDLN